MFRPDRTACVPPGLLYAVGHGTSFRHLCLGSIFPYQPELSVTPSSPTVRRAAGPTPPGGRYRIDHVLPALSPGFPRSWRVDDAGRFGLEEHDGVVASDHYGIFADLELTDPF
jgi:hypothetical protein